VNSPKNEKQIVSTNKMSEITGMQLIWEDEYILMVCCDSQAYYVYDE